MRLRVVRRTDIPRSLRYLTPLASILFALGVGAFLILVTGNDPLLVYRTIFEGTLSSNYNMAETIVKAIPLMIAGLAVSLAFRMKLWNIGVEGQMYMGACASAGLALFYPELPRAILLPGMLLVGFVAGGLWALLAALPKAYLNISEVITTLMLNNVAVLWVGYLVYGPWRDPKGMSFPLSARFVEAAQLPTFGATRVHAGLVMAVLIAAVLAFTLWRTRWGHEVRVIGESPDAARYAGMSVFRNILVVMFVSGGIAGLAGMAEVSGVIHKLQPEISQGYGYTAIVIACLARLNPWAILLDSLLFAVILVGGYSVQAAGVSASVSGMLQGVILFSVLISDFFLTYEVLRVRAPNAKAPTAVLAE